MQEAIKEKTKDIFSNISTLVNEYLDKHKDEKEFFFLQFRPDPTISTYELMQVMMINNTLFSLYGIIVTPFNSFFVSSEMYYNMISSDLISKHFVFSGSETLNLTDAYDRINNSIN